MENKFFFILNMVAAGLALGLSVSHFIDGNDTAGILWAGAVGYNLALGSIYAAGIVRRWLEDADGLG